MSRKSPTLHDVAALVLVSVFGASLAFASTEELKAKPASPPQAASTKKPAGDDEKTDEKSKAGPEKAKAATAQPGFNTIEEIVALDSAWLLSETEAAATPADVRWLPLAPLNKQDERTARPGARLSSTTAR